MYKSNRKFLEAMRDFVITPLLRITIGDKVFTHDDILKDSFRCCNQNVSPNDIKLGGVFVGELKMTLLGASTDSRGSWVGKVINGDFGLLTEEGEEYIPLPSKSYTIYEAEWSEVGLSLVAYDNMVKLDKTYDKTVSGGTAWQWLQYISKSTGLALGMTQDYVESLPNGSKLVGIDNADKLDTYRDVVSYLAAVLGGFATIDRTGSLIIKSFKYSQVEDTIDETERFSGCTFSDYKTRYTGLSVVDKDNKVKYYHRNPDDGLVMKLGDNPFLKLGTEQEEIRTNILYSLENFNYVPFNVTLLGACAYDLGDLILFSGGIADRSEGCIMSYDFGMNSYSVSGYGDNPALQSAQSKTDKNISGLVKSKSEGEVAITNMMNLDRLSIDSTWKMIGSCSFSVSKTQIVLFHGVCKLNLTRGGNIRVKYEVNQEELPFIHDVHVTEGTDTITLFLPFSCEANVLNMFRVYISSDDAYGFVEPYDFRAGILGVGLNKSDFDGELAFTDSFSVPLAGGQKIAFTEAIQTSIHPAIVNEVIEPFALNLNGGLAIAFNDEATATLDDVVVYRKSVDGGFVRITSDGKYRKLNTEVDSYGTN